MFVYGVGFLVLLFTFVVILMAHVKTGFHILKMYLETLTNDMTNTLLTPTSR